MAEQPREGKTGSDGPSASPDFLSNKPQRGAGVRRLNRVPIFIVAGLAAIFAGVMGYTMHQRSGPKGHAGSNPDQSDSAPTNGDAAFLKTAPTSGIIPESAPAKKPPAAAGGPQQLAAASTPVPGVPAGGGGATAGHSATHTPADDAWRDYQQEVQHMRERRLDAEHQALEAGTEVDTKQRLSDAGAAGGALGASSDPLRSALLKAQQARADAASLAASVSAGGAGGAPGLPGGGGVPDLSALTGGGGGGGGLNSSNGQSAKRDFLNQQPVGSDYLKTGRAAPISPYEIKAGTVIPANMVGGVNSDLPGQLIAQVSENVYDTATGRYILIPQGAKLIGTYDNGVTFGQSRVLVGWQRIIYPDASSLDLGRMPGADESGYAGFKDQVDNHLIRLFGEAFLLSIFSAGIQLGQPQASNGTNYNSTQIVSAAIAQQMGELGTEIVRRNMDIAPTLEIRPGYTFNVMVTKDMVIRPWADVADSGQ